MKRIQTLCLLGALLCGLCGTAWGSTPRTTGNSPRIEVKGTTDDDENERLERDERHVKSLMRQSRSGEAIEYLQQTLTNKYPTDANVQFGYATLLQNWPLPSTTKAWLPPTLSTWQKPQPPPRKSTLQHHTSIPARHSRRTGP